MGSEQSLRLGPVPHEAWIQEDDGSRRSRASLQSLANTLLRSVTVVVDSRCRLSGLAGLLDCSMAAKAARAAPTSSARWCFGRRQVLVLGSHDAKHAPLDPRPGSSAAHRHSGMALKAVASQLEAPLAKEEQAASLNDWSKTLQTGQTVIKQLLSAYSAALQTSPVLTKALTSFCGFALGDCLAQSITGVGGFDVFRCLRLSLYGLCLDGPLGHAWYRLLDSNLYPEAPTSTQAVLAKTAADQLVWAPVMTAVFFAFLKLLEGRPEEIAPTIQDLLIRTVLANYVLWPAAHFASFRFVPSEYRILYNNTVALAWTAYLSWACAGPVDSTAGAAGAPWDVGGAPTDLAQPGGRLAGSHCAHRVQQALLQQHQQGGAGALLEEGRQALALERILATWGWQGLPGGEAASHLLQQYLGGGLPSVAQQLCSVPVRTLPSKL